MLKSKHDSYWQSKRAPAYKYSKLALDYLSYLSYLICLSTPSILIIPIVPSYAPSLAGRDGVGLSHIQLCAPKVVAMAVRMVMRMLRTFPQVELLLNVPIVLKLV